jgi:uncharacterized protein (TIGR00730 family)
MCVGMSDLRQKHARAVEEKAVFGAGWINTVAVYCGSRIGESDEYAMEAYKLGYMLAESGFKIVFGGGNYGLMGAVKAGALAYNLPRGILDGVIEYNPGFFHGGQGAGGAGIVSNTVDDVFERKKQFILKSQVHVAVAGGVGSGDEIFDVMIAADTSPLASPKKPVPHMILVDTGQIYSKGLKPYIDKTVDEGFTAPDRVDQVMSMVPDAHGALDMIKKLNSRSPMMPQQLAKKQNAQNTDYNTVLNRNAGAMNAFLAERGEKPLFRQPDDQPIQRLG